MTLALYIFWISIAILFYTYVGYGILVFFISKVRRKKTTAIATELPEVTMLIAAYNEEDFIRAKIINTLTLDYPKERLNVAMVTDGSTDKTPEIIQQYPEITLYHTAGRKGKIHAVNRVMPMIKTPIVIFSDANTSLNKEAIREIVKHYADKHTGGVAGEKRVEAPAEAGEVSVGGEGLYWKYESFLKKKDAEIGSVVGAAGELFSIRTELYEPPNEDMIIEDFYMSLRIAQKGYRFAYEPKAYAIESGSVSIGEEWKRKVRICAGAFQAMLRLKPLLNPFAYPMLSFQYISHRVLRWTLAPLSLLTALVSNIFLAQTSWFYSATLIAQVAFYLVAMIGYILRDKPVTIKGFFVPLYFCMMNLAVYAGLRRFIKGKQSVVWEKAARKPVSQN